MNRILRGAIVVLGAICGASFAAAPGLFVVQEARFVDPGPNSVTKRTSFGMAQFALIGDMDKDGIQDLIAGAPLQDSGSLYIQPLSANGKPKGLPVEINARHSKIKAGLEAPPYADQFGASVAVLAPFSPTRSCAVVATTSGAVRKLWILQICRDPVSFQPSLQDAKKYSDTSTIFASVGLNGITLGTSLAVIDTVDSDNPVLAIGAHTDGATNASGEGRVILVRVNVATLTATYLSVIPKIYGAGDPVGLLLAPSEAFGFSIAPWRTANGGKGIAVLGSQYAAGTAITGRVHLIPLNANFEAQSGQTVIPTSSPATTYGAFSIATADFDHDGVMDLALGFNKDNPGAVADQGLVKILLMNANGTPKDSTFVRKGSSGFVDSGSLLTTSCQFGTKIVAADFDGDQQIDLLVGSRGNLASAALDVVGSIWPLRMKALPWRHKPVDSLFLNGTAWNGHMLSNYVTGNNISWKLLPPAVLPDPVASCKLTGTGLATKFECIGGTSNGVTKLKVVASDDGNLPATDHFTDTLEFPVKLSGINAPPEQKKQFSTILINEDHADTGVLDFNEYFRDPDNAALIYDVTTYDGAATNLIGYRLSTNKDSLYLKPVQYKYGICSLKVVARDNFGVTIEAKIKIEVVHVNHRPKAFADDFSVPENKTTEMDVLVNDQDIDNDPMTIIIASAPLHGKVEVKNGRIAYTPTAFYTGEDAFTYKVKDQLEMSDAVNCKVTVTPATGAPVVYKSLRDTTVPGDSPPIQIHIDSLFFSGTTRFNFDLSIPIVNDCQSLAKISYDNTTKILTLSPILYQSGRCDITLRDYVKDNVSDVMTLFVDFVPHPYQFKDDKISLRLTAGKDTKTVVLDSFDLDRNEIEYYGGPGWPDWISITGDTLKFVPVLGSLDVNVKLMARRKVAAGSPVPNPTDSMAVAVTVDEVAGLRGRNLGGLTVDLNSQPGFLRIQAGKDPFSAELISLGGQCVARIKGDANEIRVVALPRSSSNVFLRLREGSRTTITPLFLKR